MDTVTRPHVAIVNSSHARAYGTSVILYVQLVLTALVSVCLLFAPPVKGAIRIIKLPMGSSPFTWLDRTFDWRLVSAPNGGGNNLIIYASRADLFMRALSHGAIIIAAKPLICGQEIGKKSP